MSYRELAHSFRNRSHALHETAEFRKLSVDFGRRV